MLLLGSAALVFLSGFPVETRGIAGKIWRQGCAKTRLLFPKRPLADLAASTETAILRRMAFGHGPLSRTGFRRLWIGQTASLLGDAVFFLIFFYMVDRAAGGDARIVGLVTALMALPFVLFGPAAGRAADRLDRRWIMVASDAGSTLLMGTVGVWSFFQPVPPWPLLAVAGFGVGAANAFFLPARLAAIPRLVEPSEVAQANGLFLTTGQVAYMAGLTISAVGLSVLENLLPQAFFASACLINAATFAVSALVIARLPQLKPLEEPQPRSFWGDVADGLRAVSRDRLVTPALWANVLISICISGFFVAYLRVNREWFAGTFQSLAGIEVAFALTAAVVGLFVGRIRIDRPGLAFMLGTIIIGATVAWMGFARDYWVFVIANIGAGLAFPFLIVPLTSYIQLAFADNVRGRVNSAWTMSQEAVKPIGLVLTGVALDSFGLVFTFVAMGVGMAVAGVFGLAFPAVRRTRMPKLDGPGPVVVS